MVNPFKNMTEKEGGNKDQNEAAGGSTESDKSISASINIDEVAEIFKKHVEVKQRHHLLTDYEDCFTGSDACTVLVEKGMASSRKDAVQLGRRLASECHLFEHVTRQHPFKDSKDKLYHFLDLYDSEEFKSVDPETDISDPSRRIHIVTTAALPWRTGTAVNPLMRALFLTRGRPKHHVTLMVPWLEDSNSRISLYGEEKSFEDGGKAAQEEHIREYCRTRGHCEEEEKNLRIVFWNGRYVDVFKSIFPIEDICSLVPKEEADICILEEPEHLNWFPTPPVQKSGVGADGNNNAAATNDELGWLQKFRHVIGVIHTNYSAYIRQYGYTTSLVTEPALNKLSAMMVRAYCTKAIRLSDTLPSYDASKEVTCNIHGVRSEFLDPPVVKEKASGVEKCAPVYFVGKVIWAKGFDLLLELQERYKVAFGVYFPMDIYGGGDDMKAIQRAFFGIRNKAIASDALGKNVSPEEDKRALEVFDRAPAIRTQVCYGDITDDDDHAAAQETAEETTIETVSESKPIDVIGDLSLCGVTTGAETADAGLKIIDTLFSGFCSLGKEVKEPEPTSSSSETVKHTRPNAFPFVPPLARFKWRRTPLPARFLGGKDHVIVRDMPEQKIFLNMSTTEVLCTTSAEAIAMGKFVILPEHPSNDFFYQFSNCLVYKDLDDCVKKLAYALEKEPEPLSEKEARLISWEGATERLFEVSTMTKEEKWQRRESGKVEEDFHAARFHVESAKRSRFVTNLFNGKAFMRSLSPLTLRDRSRSPVRDASSSGGIDDAK